MGIGRLTDKYTVNGSQLYAPTHDGVNVGHDNIVSSDSGRTEAGIMHIRWVRPDVRKVSLSWDRLTGNEVARIVSLMQGKEFTFGYYDNGMQSMHGYCGKVEYDVVSLARHASEGGLYKNIKANVVEI